MTPINNFIDGFSEHFPLLLNRNAWEITNNISSILEQIILQIKDDNCYEIKNNIAIHKTTIIEKNVVLKGPIIIGPNCFVAANTYFRGGVYLSNGVKIGPGSEIKSSIILSNSSTAHFNYIGNSIVGNNVNFEAGAVVANHYNERIDRKISVYFNSEIIQTNTEKFGALVGDHSRIGANAVLSPGTILPKNSIVKRLELVEQIKI